MNYNTFTYQFLLSLISIVLRFREVQLLNKSVARLPPMGWSTYFIYGDSKCHLQSMEKLEKCYSEVTIKKATDLLVAKNYDKFGYKYVLMDDCWQGKVRDDQGRIQPDEEMFPNGMKSLAEYVHNKNMKLGIFSDLGPKTGCTSMGSAGHLESDANTFIEWDMDYVKISSYWAWVDKLPFDHMSIHFGKCLKKTNRSIVYANTWPSVKINKQTDIRLVAAHINVWRFSHNVEKSWSNILAIMDEYAKKQHTLGLVAGFGSWSDGDVLIAGIAGTDFEQAKAQFAVWSIMPSPLIFSAKIDEIDSQAEKLLKNRKVIEVNQDPLGIPGYKLKNENSVDTWMRPIAPIENGYHSYALAFVNRDSGRNVEYETTLEDMGLDSPSVYLVTDLFSTATDDEIILTLPSSRLKMRINAAGVVMYKATPVTRHNKNGTKK